jgi:hypothetical protein
METTEDKTGGKTKKCGCFCHKMDGVFYVAAGVIILLWALDVIKGNVVWIIIGALVIATGLQRILSGFCKCCDKA